MANGKRIESRKCYPVDIEFQNLNLSVKDKSNVTGHKKILDSLSGKFTSGNLTAILGPSGAGKSTLLDELAGYRSTGLSYSKSEATGSIKVNNEPRNMQTFKKISTYIVSGDLTQPYFSVQESMMIAANLKLSSRVSKQDKENVVKDITSTLGLTNCLNTRTEHLSGGERKRLCIALELVNNPAVIFLDEPTTGIDNVAAKYCIELLKSLARQGRTVILSIHQPSDSLFELIDNVYFMGKGRCTYNGPVKDLVPFLSSAGFPCPLTFSPADYIIELSELSTENINVLASGVTKVVENGTDFTKDLCSMHYEKFDDFQTIFHEQFFILLKRNLLKILRNTTALLNHIMAYIVISILTGMLGYGIGNDASMVFENFRLVLLAVSILLFSNGLPPALLYPYEIKIVEREYFNRWYRLKAYHLSLMVAPLPVIVVMGVVFVGIIYVMTDQLMDIQRFVYFALPCILLAITAHGLGIAIACIFSPQAGSIIVPASLALTLVVGIHGMGYGSDIHPFAKIFMLLSFVRHGLVAICNAVYIDRANLECSELFCLFVKPNNFLKALGMNKCTYIAHVFGLTFFLVLFQYMVYLLLKFRLNRDNHFKLNKYIRRFLKSFK